MSSPELDPVGVKAVETGLNIGLFHRMTGTPEQPSTLASDCGVSERGLRPLLYLLGSIGLLQEDKDGLFSLHPETEHFLSETWAGQEEKVTVPEEWRNLEQAVRTGRCVRPPIEGEEDGGNFFSGVVETLFGLHSKIAWALEANLPGSINRVLDLGAGSAVWSLGIAAQRNDVSVVAVDLEKVLEKTTRKFVERYDATDRYEFRSGSYHAVPVEEEHYDLIYLGHIIHSEGWEASCSLIQRCRKALRSGGLLAIAEWVGSKPRSADYHANLFHLNMLMFTENGLVFDAQEMEELCREAKYEHLRWVKGPGKYPVLLAQKP